MSNELIDGTIPIEDVSHRSNGEGDCIDFGGVSIGG